MKKLDIQQGGHPLTGDDLLYMQSALIEVISKIVKSQFGDFVVLDGFEYSISAGTITWTDGWFYMDGEIYKIDAGSASYSSNNTIAVVETSDPAGDVTYENTDTVSTYLVRKVTVSGYTTGNRSIPYVKRVKGFVEWANVTLLGNWTAPSMAPVVGLNANGAALMKNAVAVVSYNNSADTVLFNVAAAYRPVVTKYVTVAAIAGSSYSSVVIEINTDGDIKPKGLSNGTAYTLFLDLTYILG